MMDNGKIIKCKEKEQKYGKMVMYIPGIGNKIKEMDLAN